MQKSASDQLPGDVEAFISDYQGRIKIIGQKFNLAQPKIAKKPTGAIQSHLKTSFLKTEYAKILETQAESQNQIHHEIHQKYMNCERGKRYIQVWDEYESKIKECGKSEQLIRRLGDIILEENSQPVEENIKIWKKFASFATKQMVALMCLTRFKFPQYKTAKQLQQLLFSDKTCQLKQLKHINKTNQTGAPDQYLTELPPSTREQQTHVMKQQSFHTKKFMIPNQSDRNNAEIGKTSSIFGQDAQIIQPQLQNDILTLPELDLQQKALLEQKEKEVQQNLMKQEEKRSQYIQKITSGSSMDLRREKSDAPNDQQSQQKEQLKQFSIKAESKQVSANQANAQLKMASFLNEKPNSFLPMQIQSNMNQDYNESQFFIFQSQALPEFLISNTDNQPIQIMNQLDNFANGYVSDGFHRNINQSQNSVIDSNYFDQIL